MHKRLRRLKEASLLLRAGLEDQLLGKLILKEKHELEEQRQQLLEEVQSYKKKIKQLEDDLLFR